MPLFFHLEINFIKENMDSGMNTFLFGGCFYAKIIVFMARVLVLSINL